jgi:peptidoglycan/xylan/chitin deacetylase (PgdA/CDA1 family)
VTAPRALPSALFAALGVLLMAGCGSSPSQQPPTRRTATATRRTSRVPAARKVKGPHHQPVPILMYHVVQSPPPHAANPQLFVSAATFGAQVRHLAGLGYHGVTLEQVFDYWRNARALPPKPVVVSFDDGYASQYTNALPVLRSVGWTGVLDLAVHNERVAGGMSVAKLRRLVAAGWEVDSHTVSHVDVTTLDATGLQREVAGSRQFIRRQLHVPVDFFCYPSGRFDAAAIAAVMRAGYLGATTTQPGLARAASPYTLARIRINGADGATTPAEKIRAAGG